MPSLIPGPPAGAPICIRTHSAPNLVADLRLVPRLYWPRLTSLLGATTAAAYMLVDSVSDGRRIRAGETQDIAQRLVRHRADRAMDWADVAVVISGPSVDKGMAVALQESLEIYLRNRAEVTLMALAPAQTPRISEEEWRRVARLTLAILSTLPRLGVILTPAIPRDCLEGVQVVERVFDVAEIDQAYVFAARGLQAAVARIGEDFYILAGSEIRDQPAECARNRHKDLRRELAATRRLFASYAPGRVRIASPIWASSLDAAGKMIVGDRHRYNEFWVETKPGDLPAACLEQLAGRLDPVRAGGRL